MNFYQLPKSVDNKKLVVILIGLIFSSALITASLSVFNSINSIEGQVYGESENIVVISNNQKTTPFTSFVDSYLEQQLEQIPGVLTISPEILVPVTIGDNTVIIRGVELDKFRNITNFKITSGKVGFVESPHDISIDEKLANRLNLGVLDIVKLKSSLNNMEQITNITATHTETSIQNDEIVTSINVARKLSPVKQDQYGHFRVEFDPDITSKSKIKQLVTQKYKVELNALTENGTEKLSNWQLEVLDYDYNRIIKETVKSSSKILQLPFGKYIISASSDKKNQTKEVFVDKNLELDFIVGGLFYKTSFDILTNDQPMKSYVKIENNDNGIVYENYTDSTGKMEVILKEGKYKVSIWQDTHKKVYDIVVMNQTHYTFNNQFNIDKPSIFGLNNGSIIPDENQIFFLAKRGYEDIIVLIDGKKVEILNDSYFRSTLDNGMHNLTIIENSTNQIKQLYKFSVNSERKPIQLINFSNQAKLVVNETRQINLTGLIMDSLSIFTNIQYNINNNNLQLTPQSLGMKTITIEATKYNGASISRSFTFNITKIDHIVGIFSNDDTFNLPYENEVPYWYNSKVNNITLNEIPLEFTTDTIFLPNLDTGEYNLTLHTDKQNVSKIITIINENIHSDQHHKQDKQNNQNLRIENMKTIQLNTANRKIRSLFIEINNLNFGTISSYEGIVSLSLPNTDIEIVRRYTRDQPLIVPSSTFEVQLEEKINSSKLVNMETLDKIQFDSRIINGSGTIDLTNNNIHNIKNLELKHDILGITMKINVDPDYRMDLQDYPIGPVTLRIVTSMETVEYGFIFSNHQRNYIIILNVNQSEIGYNKLLNAGSNVDVSSNDDVLAQSEGILSFSDLVLIVESLLVLIVLIVVTSGIFMSFMYQNRSIVKILISLGFTDYNIIFSMLKFIYYLSIPLFIIGGYAGYMLTQILFDLEKISIFGIQILPQLNWQIWVFGYVSLLFLVTIGSKLGLMIIKSNTKR